MGCVSTDLTIEGALADPVVRAAMRADKVDPRGFEFLLRDTAARIERPRSRLAALVARASACRGGAEGATRPW